MYMVLSVLYGFPFRMHLASRSTSLLAHRFVFFTSIINMFYARPFPYKYMRSLRHVYACVGLGHAFIGHRLLIIIYVALNSFYEFCKTRNWVECLLVVVVVLSIGFLGCVFFFTACGCFVCCDILKNYYFITVLLLLRLDVTWFFFMCLRN